MKGCGSRLSAAFHVCILPADYVQILQKSKTICDEFVKKKENGFLRKNAMMGVTFFGKMLTTWVRNKKKGAIQNG